MINAVNGLPSTSAPNMTSMPMGVPASPTFSPKKKTPMRMIIGGIVLLILIIGGIAAYMLFSSSTELRQQAAGENTGSVCGSTCEQNSDCASGNVCGKNAAGQKQCILTACSNSSANCDASKCSVRMATAVEGVTPEACTIAFTVGSETPPPEIGFNCEKTAWRDELSNSAGSYTLTQQQSQFLAGDVVVYRVIVRNTGEEAVTVSLQDVLTANNMNLATFMDSSCGASAYNATTKTLTCPGITAAANANAVPVTFRVRLNSSIANGTVLTNTGTATGGGTTASCSVNVTVNTTTNVVYSCNSNCSADAQCQTANTNYVCSSGRCRLNTNTSSDVCNGPDDNPTYSCNSSCTNNTQCQTANTSFVCYNGACRRDSNPTASDCSYGTTTVIGCNQNCSTNADCSSSSHVCVDTDQGRVCRLATNPSSASCSPETTTTTTTTTGTTKGGQPVQPQELPVSGASDNILKFLGIGAGVLILGAAGLLLL